MRTPPELIPAEVKLIAPKLAKVLGFSFDAITGKRRPASLVFARHCIMLVCCERATTAEVGGLMNRDHSDVVHACKKLRVQESVYPDIAAVLERLRLEAAELLTN